jgi:hypothetical protein
MDIGTASAQQRPAEAGRESTSERIAAWQCIGCGRIEAPQTCIGICQDRRVEFVYASDHAALEEALAATKRERDAWHALVRRLAFSRPRCSEWERSYRALQTEARTLLSAAHSHRGIADARK